MCSAMQPTGLLGLTCDKGRCKMECCNGTNTGKVCWQNESCVDILFYQQCTTTYKYYPAPGAGGSGDTDTSLQPSGSCMWGRDYLGWEPSRCD